MAKLIHPLWMLIAQAAEKQLVQYIEHLKAENRILRGKLLKRTNVAMAERARLIKLGVRLGHQGTHHDRPPSDIRWLG